jgi:hypothetical protein
MKTIKIIFCVMLFVTTSVLRVYAQDTTYKSVIEQLFKIDELDQRYRLDFDDVINKYGNTSKEIHDLCKKMNYADSINCIQVKSIIEKYGWLGVNEIGFQCNAALFMVIQHADLKTQEEYLPIIREAVKNGKLKASRLALLEDRVALKHGKKQIYGSQVGQNGKTLEYYILPLLDPDNVDKRRATVGLNPLSEYVSFWNIKWDVEGYKKDLPMIEAESLKDHQNK